VNDLIEQKVKETLVMGQFYKACLGVDMFSYTRVEMLGDKSASPVFNVCYEFSNSGIELSVQRINKKLVLSNKVNIQIGNTTNFHPAVFTREQMTKLRVHFNNDKFHMSLEKHLTGLQ
jgi:hypothetical protein